MRPKIFLLQAPLALLEPPLALAQLSGYLKAHAFDVELMDVSAALFHRHRSAGANLWSEETNEIWARDEVPAEILGADRAFLEREFLDRIAAAERPVVGFSATACSFPASLLLARWVKERRPDALVAFGGQIFTTTPSTARTIAARPEVDAVVVGDGEEALAELALRHAEGRDPAGCAGLFVRDAEGRPAHTGERPPLDLDALPFADFTSFDMSRYGTAHAGPHDLVMMTSRGCVRRCSFCGHRTAWHGFRQMSGERVHAEIRHQRRTLPSLAHPDSEIKFYDLLINGDMRKLRRLAELLRAESEPPLPWKEANAVIRPEMTEELCRSLREAGCRMLIIGLESGSQKVLDLMDKGQTVEQMKTVLRAIDRAGLQTRGNFMFGHPGETEEDFQATLEFLKEMHPVIHQVYPSFTLTHLDGRLLQDPQAWGIASAQDPLYWESEDKSSTYPVRLERFARFRALAASLGAKVVDGLQMPVEAYTDYSLAGYFEARGERDRALRHYRRYLETDPSNAYVRGKVSALATPAA